MAKSGTHLRWGVEKRLEFIEFRLFWEGEINRSNLIDQFGVSMPQASMDLKSYLKLAPRNMIYDGRVKRYLASPHFKPMLLDLNPEGYFRQLRLTRNTSKDGESWLSFVPQHCLMPIPQRKIEPRTLQSLIGAIKNGRSLKVEYQSLSDKTTGPKWRWITPHAFANDGFRWHVRAYCHKNLQFRDFILSRFLNVAEMDVPAAGSEEDADWNNEISVSLTPNPKLSPAQKNIIALDYAMKKDVVTIQVKQALLYYFKTRLCLDRMATENPYEVPVVIANREEFERALKEAVGKRLQPTNNASSTKQKVR